MYKVFYQFIGVRDKYSFCIADSHLTKHSHLYYVEQKKKYPAGWESFIFLKDLNE